MRRAHVHHYECRCPEQAGLKQRINEICQTRMRCGYRIRSEQDAPDLWRVRPATALFVAETAGSAENAKLLALVINCLVDDGK
jgi:hypothetical protein